MMSHSPQTGLRKAAILVAALDRASADDVLQRMDADHVRLVRQAMVDLGPVDPEEERRVIEDFFRVGPMVPRQQPSGVELDGRLARRLAARAPYPTEPTPSTAEANAQPFRFLHQAECEEIAKLLAAERSQTIALVLSHLPPEQAGGVLVLLPEAAQVEVVRRLVDLEETDAEVLREVEQGLQARLAQHVPMRRRRATGAAAVSGILKASEQLVGHRILDNLAMHDERLARQFAPQRPEIAPPAFEELLQLDAASLAAVLEAAAPELLTLALVGAPTSVIDQMLEPLPSHRAWFVRRELEDLPPTRLSDIEAARRQLAEVARELAMAGRIKLPREQEASLHMMV
jgi:flagellar motor switch protein FliG